MWKYFCWIYENWSENFVLTQEIKDLLKDATTFKKIIQKYNQYYKKNTISIIESISNAKALEYLNLQAKIEKFQFKKCLEHKNINNKEDFKFFIILLNI